MPEPLTLGLISELMPKLYAAFPRTIKGDQRTVLDTYRNGLRGLSGDAVRAAVDRAIQDDAYFPKVSRLRELATQWSRHNTVQFEQPAEARWDECPVCGVRARPRTITRFKRDPQRRYALVLDEHQQPILEEVESVSLYIDHDPRKHHVHQGEPA